MESEHLIPTCQMYFTISYKQTNKQTHTHTHTVYISSIFNYQCWCKYSHYSYIISFISLQWKTSLYQFGGIKLL